MPEPISFTEDAIRARWKSIAALTIPSNRDYVRIGEQAVMDVPALLDALEAARYAAGRCRATTTIDRTDREGRCVSEGPCVWCELPDGHAGKHHASIPQSELPPVAVDWRAPEAQS